MIDACGANDRATALRSAGGTVAWVLPAAEPSTPARDEFLGPEIAARSRGSGGVGPLRDRVWPEFDVSVDDLLVEKTAASACFPGRRDLPELLARRQVETVLIVGTVANVCCESTARDASTLGYRVIVVADANAATRDEDLNATLHTIYRSFGDVRPTDEVVELIGDGARCRGGSPRPRAVTAPDPTAEPLRLYGTVSDRPRLAWESVRGQLTDAGTYWVVAQSATSHPHPRPVWGIWAGRALTLSIGSPVLTAALRRDARVTVHLESGTEVVVVEGAARVVHEPDPELLAAYDAKYGWSYSFEEHGPLTQVDASAVLAWRSLGWAGRDGFEAVGRWTFD